MSALFDYLGLGDVWKEFFGMFFEEIARADKESGENDDTARNDHEDEVGRVDGDI